jgi:subtilisin family serine protease
MRHRREVRIVVHGAVFMATALLLAGAAAPAMAHTVRPGVVVVQLVEAAQTRGLESGVPALDAEARRYGVTGLRAAFDLDWSRNADLKRRFGLDRFLVLQFPADAPVSEIAARLSQVEGVAHAEPDVIGQGGQVPPNDTHFPDQWHLDNTGQIGGTPGADVSAVEGWAFGTGSPAIVVAVLDTGIDSAHPEFAGRIVPGFDFVNEDADPEGDHSHGTLVAGITLANANNALQVAGLDWSAKLMPLKVLDANNLGATTDLVDALVWAADHGADIINMSLINYPCSGALQNALQYAVAAGCVPIASSGNGGVGNADSSGPGCLPETISTGATDNRDRRASFSGTGAALDVIAPGEGVRTVQYHIYSDGFFNFSGTSAAAPVAAGIAALLRGLDPTLTVDEVRALIESNADDQVGPPAEDVLGRDNSFGWGRANLREAMAAVNPDPLRRGRVRPATLGTGGSALFSVVYTSASSTSPDFVRVVLSGPQAGTFAMSPSTSITTAHPSLRDGNLTNGEQYDVGFVLVAAGTYAFHFEAAVGGSPLRYPAAGEISGPDVTQVLADDVALAETSVDSTIFSGNYTATFALDNNSEILDEVSTHGGPPAQRFSTLDHRYQFNVTGGDQVSFHVSASRVAFWPLEDDRYLFSYSVNGGTSWTPMVTVADDPAGTYQTFVLPGGTQGQVLVRVEDTDSTPGNTGLDRLFIDHMFFRSEIVPEAMTVHVASQNVVRVAVGGPNRRAEDTVVIRNQDGQPVAGAQVNASYTGPTSGTVTGVTNASGAVVLASEKTKNNLGLEWCFTVTAVTVAGATYDPGQNVVTTQCESGPQ